MIAALYAPGGGWQGRLRESSVTGPPGAAPRAAATARGLAECPMDSAIIPRRDSLWVPQRMKPFWYLVEDFFEQPLIIKVALAWGWVSVLVMILSLGSAIAEVV